MQQDKILVFAFNHSGDRVISPDSCYRGYFDGQDFIPRKIGYCESIEELYEYDYVQLFGDNGAQSHIPKREYRDLLESMQQSYLEVFGKGQISLFL
ncbi:hypothetical protein ABD91_17215 [Lysinibacillus sphaericus]|uniref:hypothetical protein n=1 Tax=Lysinibacillus sphaericus TaxID=1421 RepID=UPI0018CCA3C3|nr:hypothetical protein [Lysinibacillus sphaericus]MBG9692537.1 hypothetical protein [Lysinibacillus sphaericus]